jgi:hypothetical protein
MANTSLPYRHRAANAPNKKAARVGGNC